MEGAGSPRSPIKRPRWKTLWWDIQDWAPVVTLVFLFLGSYYVFIVLLSLQKLILQDRIAEGVTFIAVYHVLLFPLLWSMIQSIVTDPGHPPPRAAQTLMTDPVDYPSHAYCQRCDLHKPDRSSHCSECKRCVLKMDHHCPWINNCVGYFNYKFYFLFLFYAVIFMTFLMTVLAVEGILFLVQEPVKAAPIVFLVFALVTFMLYGPVVLLLVYHAYLVWHNKTTIENIKEGPKSCWNVAMSRVRNSAPAYDIYAFDLGPLANIKQVFGENAWTWCLPIGRPPGDGIHFPMKASPKPPSIEPV